MTGSDVSRPDRQDRAIAPWAASLLAVLVVHGAVVTLMLMDRTPVDPIALPPAIAIDLVAASPVPTPLLPEPKAAVTPPRPVVAPTPAVKVPPAPKPVIAVAPPRHPRMLPRHPPKPSVLPRAVPQPTLPPNPIPLRAAAKPAAAPHATPLPTVAATSIVPPSFAGTLLAYLSRYKHYPYAAREAHQEGEAWLRFTMDRSGRVLAYRLERGTGIATLDAETLALIRRAEPLPPIPADMPQQSLELIVPIRFSLR